MMVAGPHSLKAVPDFAHWPANLGRSSQSFMAEKGLDKEGEPSSYGIRM